MRPLAVVVLAALCASPGLSAQAKPAGSATNNKNDSDSTESESEQQPPRFAFGGRAGMFHLSDSYHQRAFGVVLQWRATEWLTLSANPGYATVDTTVVGRTRSRSGLTDLPLGVTLSHDFDAQLHPSLSLGTEVTLPTGDTLSGVGSGETSVGMNLGLGLAPAARFNVYLGAWHSVSGSAGASALSAVGATSLDAELSYDIWRRLTGSASFSADVGTPDNVSGCGMSGAPPCEIAERSIAAGVALGVAGPWTVTLDGSHSVSVPTPHWTMSLGVGTAFAGVSPISGLHRRLGFLQGALRCTGGRRSRRGSTTRSCSAAGP